MGVTKIVLSHTHTGEMVFLQAKCIECLEYASTQYGVARVIDVIITLTPVSKRNCPRAAPYRLVKCSCALRFFRCLINFLAPEILIIL
jgi:hypothetical protein